MEERNYTIDLIRVIALLGVIIDHYLQQSECKQLINIGLCAGGISVSMFLTISAYIYGVKWQKTGFKGIEIKDFIKKRCLRIFIPLWLTLLLAIPLEIYANHEITMKMVFLNFLGLGWFCPFMWQGHLWYITMTLIMYVSFLFISYIRFDKLSIWIYAIAYLCLSIIIISFPQQFNSTTKSIIPLTLIYSTMMFSSGNNVLKYCKQNRMMLTLITIILLCISFYLFIWHHNLHKGILVIFYLMTGLFICLTCMVYINIKVQNKIINWLSMRSYEIYLIHQTAMCFVFMLTGKGFLNILFGILLIIGSGHIISFICNKLYKIIK